jgi:hypothetical protein
MGAGSRSLYGAARDRLFLLQVRNQRPRALDSVLMVRHAPRGTSPVLLASTTVGALAGWASWIIPAHPREHPSL